MRQERPGDTELELARRRRKPTRRRCSRSRRRRTLRGGEPPMVTSATRWPNSIGFVMPWAHSRPEPRWQSHVRVVRRPNRSSAWRCSRATVTRTWRTIPPLPLPIGRCAHSWRGWSRPAVLRSMRRRRMLGAWRCSRRSGSRRHGRASNSNGRRRWTIWAGGLARWHRTGPFRPGLDDEELHADDLLRLDRCRGTHRSAARGVAGAAAAGPWFDADLVVLARRDGGTGPVAGVAWPHVHRGRRLGARSSRWGDPIAGSVSDGRLLSRRAIGWRRRAPRMLGLGVEAENANGTRAVPQCRLRGRPRVGALRAHLTGIVVGSCSRDPQQGDVAQLARAPALQAGGRGFDSHRLHQV